MLKRPRIPMLLWLAAAFIAREDALLQAGGALLFGNQRRVALLGNLQPLRPWLWVEAEDTERRHDDQGGHDCREQQAQGPRRDLPVAVKVAYADELAEFQRSADTGHQQERAPEVCDEPEDAEVTRGGTEQASPPARAEKATFQAPFLR